MKKISKREFEQIEGVDEIVNMDIVRKPLQDTKKLKDYQLNEKPEPMPSPEKKEAIKKFNDDFTVKLNGIIAIEKKYFYMFLLFGIVLVIALIWMNISISQGKLSDDVDIFTDITNNYTIINEFNQSQQNIINNNINITVQFPDDITIKIKNESD